MNENLQAAKEALRRSRLALRKGEKDVARRWAEKAAILAPTQEDPWLILAATSRPQLSIHYLERALAINPHSQNAQKGMRWARQKLAEQAKEKTRDQQILAPTQKNLALTQPQRPQAATRPSRAVRAVPISTSPKLAETLPRPAAHQRRSLWQLSLPALIVIVLLVSGVWALMPRITSLAATMNTVPTPTLESQNWAQAPRNKPTYTPSPTLTPTNTPTPLPTNTAEPTATPAPTEIPVQDDEPQYSYGGRQYILVDISEQHLYAYEGDTLVFSFVASTGMNNATATGYFSILNKIPSAYGGTWDIWMPNWLGIYWVGTMQNGIHALPIMSDGSILWDGYLGTPISYGCVVLGTYEAQLLYNWVEIGTPVEIRW